MMTTTAIYHCWQPSSPIKCASRHLDTFLILDTFNGGLAKKQSRTKQYQLMAINNDEPGKGKHSTNMFEVTFMSSLKKLNY